MAHLTVYYLLGSVILQVKSLYPILVYIDWFTLCRASLIPFLFAFFAAEQGKISLLKDLFMGVTRTDYSVTL